ncbi:hypothetical protein WOB59_25605, partial [Methylocystis sp. IM4]|uniref:hypothetical protein n=1 Tax=Methylocystis sp. IM4 TaxID=3136560 RepID=UPI00311A42D5
RGGIRGGNERGAQGAQADTRAFRFSRREGANQEETLQRSIGHRPSPESAYPLGLSIAVQKRPINAWIIILKIL